MSMRTSVCACATDAQNKAAATATPALLMWPPADLLHPYRLAVARIRLRPPEQPRVAVAVHVGEPVRVERRRLVAQRRDAVVARRVGRYPGGGAPAVHPEPRDSLVLALPELRRAVDLHVLGLGGRARGQQGDKDHRGRR